MKIEGNEDGKERRSGNGKVHVVYIPTKRLMGHGRWNKDNSSRGNGARGEVVLRHPSV